MKKSLLIAGALLAFGASFASAAGIDFSWNDCGTFGVQNATFACNSQAGSNTAYASVQAPAGINEFTGLEGIVDIKTADATLPAWWQHNNPDPAGCRNAINIAFAPNSSGNCFDPYVDLGGANGGHAADLFTPTPDRLRVRVLNGTASTGPLDDTVEYYAFTLQVRRNNLTTAPTCAGCSVPACLTLNEIKLAQPDAVGNNPIVTNPIHNQSITWQTDPGGFFASCILATPSKSKTWGQVKSLYR